MVAHPKSGDFGYEESQPIPFVVGFALLLLGHTECGYYLVCLLLLHNGFHGMNRAKHCVHLAGVAAIALALVGCGGGETTVRPFVKRGGDSATEKTPAGKTAAEPEKTAEKTKTDGS